MSKVMVYGTAVVVLATAANLLHPVSHTGQDVQSLEAWQLAYVVGVIFISSFPESPRGAAGPNGSRQGIAAERWEELLEFRATHPLEHVTVDGVSWDYIASGEGNEALLLLPGGAMVGEAGFTRIPAFEEGYRVIAPSYANVPTTAQLLDGLAGVLDAEGVRAAHVLGPSYGGLVA